jgi:signal recognition particle subunit SRP54
MFDSLSKSLADVFSRLRDRGKLSEKDVSEATREIRLALLEADVALPAVKSLVAGVRERAVGDEVMKALTPGQQVIKIVNEEMIKVLGGQSSPVQLASHPPTVILLAGLQGSGKTTTAAKLAAHFKSRGQRVLLVAADLQRPAAIDQLKVLGEQVGVDVVADVEATDPVALAVSALAKAKSASDVAIFDTAGRLAIDEEMMKQVAAIHDAIQPHEVLFVLDSMTGQDALVSAQAFSETLPLTGMILTKIDGDARGGAALSATSVTGKPIKFVGTGERIEDLESFHPDRIASRILGMGDVLTLIERAEETVSKKDAAEQAKKLLDASFTLDDFLDQMQQVRKMGGIGDLVKMLPGIPGASKMSDIDVDEADMVRVEAIIRSMTPSERADPKKISGSRKQRIANGSGTRVRDVNDLLKQFSAAKKMMRSLGKMAKGRGRKGRGMELPF